MSQDDETPQDQEQPEAQASGGDGGFVSLEQAREVALGHARDNRDVYDRRYRRQELAWRVLSEDEREEAYYVRLSYQPARGFLGEPGVEEFTISRSGSVQSRRIVSQPERSGKAPGCVFGIAGLLLAIVVGLVGVGL